MNRYEDLIERLEIQFPVDSLSYKGYKVWPLFRVLLFTHSINEAEGIVEPPQIKAVDLTQSKSLKAKIGDVIAAFRNLKLEYKEYFLFKSNTSKCFHVDAQNEDALGKADVVFFYYQSHRNQNINGAYVNDFLTPLREEIQTKYSCLALEDIYNPKEAKFPRYDKTVNIGAYIKKAEIEMLLNKTVGFIRLLFPFQKKNSIQGFSEFQKLLPKNLTQSLFKTEDQFIYQIEKILCYKKTVIRILEKIKPKVLVQACFYHPIGIAFNLACAELKIKSLEVQHGTLEPLAFWNYNKNKSADFSMLPQYYWLWESDSLQTINSWINGTNKALVGGNVGMRKTYKNIVISNEIQLGFEKKMQGYDYCALYAFQPSVFISIPPFVWEWMQVNKNVLWLFRVHPRTANLDIPQIKSWMEERALNNYEIDLSSSLPLAYIVQKVRVNITKFSAVVFDCALSKVPTIFIDDYAAQIYSRDYKILWNSNMIKMALNLESFDKAMMFYSSTQPDFDVKGYFGSDNYLETFDKIMIVS